MDFMAVPRSLLVACMLVCVRSRTIPTMLPPTTLMTTPLGCEYNGQYYPLGATIEEGYDPSSNWCYGTICSDDGQILNWDNFNCHTTTTSPTTRTTTPHTTRTTTPPISRTTTPPTNRTATPPTTFPPGCVYNGQHYPLGATIEEGYDPSSNWCYGTICSYDGQILNWDNFNCYTTTRPPPTRTTTPPTTRTTTPPTTIPSGCVYNGQHYPLGATIEEGHDPSSNWCYGMICSYDGQILNWDNFNCYTTTTPPTTRTTTPPTTRATTPPTTRTTTPPTTGCVYNGQHYPLGAIIEKSYDPSSNWCYETKCSDDGQILYDYNYKCYPTTTPPTTRTTTPPTTRTTTPLTTRTTTLPTTIPSGCLYNGRYFPPESAMDHGYDPVSGKCFTAICIKNGQTKIWPCHGRSDTITKARKKMETSDGTD